MKKLDWADRVLGNKKMISIPTKSKLLNKQIIGRGKRK